MKAVDDMIEKNKVPRAIICANDMMAIAAGAEFQRRGYKIPEDIIITGFDKLSRYQAHHNRKYYPDTLYGLLHSALPPPPAWQ